MNAPTIPTDNLYKFVALSGVVLVLAGLWLPQQFADELAPYVAKAGESWAKSAAQLGRLEWSADVALPADMAGFFHPNKQTLPTSLAEGADRARVTQFVDALESMAMLTTDLTTLEDRKRILGYQNFKEWMKTENGWSDEQYAAWAEAVTFRELRELTRETREAANEARTTLAILDQDLGTTWYMRDRQRRFVEYARLCFWGGLVLMFGGFVAWYQMTQRHQDSILAIQARDAERKARRPRRRRLRAWNHSPVSRVFTRPPARAGARLRPGSATNGR